MILHRATNHFRHPARRPFSSSRAKARDPEGFLMEKSFCVYILASKPNGTLYIGVTSDLVKRIWQHKSEEIAGFTKKYNVKILVYYEQHHNAEGAIHREKRLKEWKREWKLSLIEKHNPTWCDLYQEIIF